MPDAHQGGLRQEAGRSGGMLAAAALGLVGLCTARVDAVWVTLSQSTAGGVNDLTRSLEGLEEVSQEVQKPHQRTVQRFSTGFSGEPIKYPTQELITAFLT